MKRDEKDYNHIIADEGKIFRRIVSGEEYGKDIHLGYTYYIGGVLQNPPHLDTAEDFEEIDEPVIPEPQVEPWE